jgi:hypothetical protein
MVGALKLSHGVSIDTIQLRKKREKRKGKNR